MSRHLLRGIAGVVTVLVEAGCAAQTPGAPDVGTAESAGVSVAATMEQSNDRIVVDVAVQNTGASEFVGEYSAQCAIAVLFSKADDDQLQWDQYDWFNSRPGGCKFLVLPVRVPPDSEVVVSTQVVFESDVLGDSLPAGEYDVSARLHIVAPFLRTFVVRAGRAMLSR